jgi:SAM-dependent methyltransferase
MDPVVVKNARARNLDVRLGGIEQFEGNRETFDWITMSHVIEHVHDPVKVLRAAHALLKPGGRLWLETPNAASFGHRHFGAHWRGLEPPRHLVVFDGQSLALAMMSAGFFRWQQQSRAGVGPRMFAASEHIQQQAGESSRARGRFQRQAAKWLSSLQPDKAEFLNFIAEKHR